MNDAQYPRVLRKFANEKSTGIKISGAFIIVSLLKVSPCVVYNAMAQVFISSRTEGTSRFCVQAYDRCLHQVDDEKRRF